MNQIKVIRAEAAESLLTDKDFALKWEALYEACPWASAFQGYAFCKIWHDVYREDFELVLVTELNDDNLQGLLPLVVDKKDGSLSHLGTYHAEYQGWLALPENGDRFIVDAIQTLHQTFPGKSLNLMFLAPGSPIDWLDGDSKAAEQTLKKVHLRPMIDLTKVERFTESLKKKNNKYRMRQLAKFGELRTEFIATADELAEKFDEIEDFSKLRISALHDVAPVLDEKRKNFHLKLMKEAGIIEISQFKAGDRLASAQVVIRNRGERLLATTAMSPFFAAFSPSKLHIAFLAKAYSENPEIKHFDLSPGEGYKERYATDIEEAYSLNIFFSRSEYLRNKARSSVRKTAKYAIGGYEDKSPSSFKSLERIVKNSKKLGVSGALRKVISKGTRFLSESAEIRVYSMPVEKIASLPAPAASLKKDSVRDLLYYEMAEQWQLTRSDFHQVVLDRFGKGMHSYTLEENGKLLHCGWMLENQEESDVYEVGQKFKMPPGSVVLFDYYTHPEARGRGLYRNSILHGLRDAFSIPGAKQVYISVLADNAASRRVIEKIGFEYKGSLFKKTKFGKVSKWQEWMPEEFEGKSEVPVPASQDEKELVGVG